MVPSIAMISVMVYYAARCTRVTPWLCCSWPTTALSTMVILLNCTVIMIMLMLIKYQTYRDNFPDLSSMG